MERFRSRGLRFIHLNINNLLAKIEELRYIAKSINASVIGICEPKLNATVLEQEISLDNYKILRCGRNRHGGDVACYVRNHLSYNILSVFPSEIENIFFEILLPNSKPIAVVLLEVLINNMNKIDSVNNEIYILGDFNINLCIFVFFGQKEYLTSKSIPSDVKTAMNFAHFLG